MTTVPNSLPSSVPIPLSTTVPIPLPASTVPPFTISVVGLSAQYPQTERALSRSFSMRLFRANVDLDGLQISTFTHYSVLYVLVDATLMRHWDASGTSGKTPRHYLKVKLEGFNDADVDASVSDVVFVENSMFVNARLFQYYDIWRKGAATDRQRRLVMSVLFMDFLQGDFLFSNGSYRKQRPADPNAVVRAAAPVGGCVDAIAGGRSVAADSPSRDFDEDCDGDAGVVANEPAVSDAEDGAVADVGSVVAATPLRDLDEDGADAGVGSVEAASPLRDLDEDGIRDAGVAAYEPAVSDVEVGANAGDAPGYVRTPDSEVDEESEASDADGGGDGGPSASLSDADDGAIAGDGVPGYLPVSFRTEPIWLRRDFSPYGNWEGAVLSKPDGGVSKVIFYSPTARDTDHEDEYSAELIEQYRIVDPIAATRARWRGNPAEEPATDSTVQSGGRPVRRCRALAESNLYVASSDDGANADSDVDSDVGCSASRLPTAGHGSKVRVRPASLFSTAFSPGRLDSTRLNPSDFHSTPPVFTRIEPTPLDSTTLYLTQLYSSRYHSTPTRYACVHSSGHDSAVR